MGNRGRARRSVALLIALGLGVSGVALTTPDAGAAPEPLRAAGPVSCTLSGKAKLTAPLFATAQTGRSVAIKAKMSCVGQTGDPRTVVNAGTLMVANGSFTGSCAAPSPGWLAGSIKWATVKGKVQPTQVTFTAPSGTQSNPLRYNFGSATPTGSFGREKGSLRITSTSATPCGKKGIKKFSFSGTLALAHTPMRAIDIDAADGATCAVTTAGGVKCWGPGPFPNMTSGIARVALGSYSYLCAITTAGGVLCDDFGSSNTYGQLGNGTFTPANGPVQVVGLTSGVTDLDTGETHACAVQDGGAFCWGDNSDGQLGNGTRTKSNVPVPVTGLSSGVARVSVGNFHACAVLTSGAAKCWGLGANGQLGQGWNNPQVPIPNDALVPVQVEGLTSGVADISVADIHSCASLTNGRVRCWGSDGWGEAGDGMENSSAIVSPAPAAGITTATDIGIGDYHSCAALSDLTVRCWGQNWYGKVGSSFAVDTWNSPVHYPIHVSGTGAAVEVVGNRLSSCARLTDGTVRCWGRNTWGNLGDGSDSDLSWVPVTVIA